MSIKIKAVLAVVAFFSIMILVMIGILSIPDYWVKNYGPGLLKTAVFVGGFYFCYVVALDYFKAKEKLKNTSDKIF